MRARSRVRVAAVVGVTLLAACGIPKDEGPRTIGAETVPFALLDPDTDPDEADVTGAAVAASIYLVGTENLLEEVRREVPAPATPRAILTSLVEAGPDDRDREEGLGTRIPAGTRVLEVSEPVEGVVTVDVSGEMATASAESLRLALAQIVYTTTAVRGVNAVLFEFDGQLQEVPDDNSEQTAEPVRRADYAELLADD